MKSVDRTKRTVGALIFLAALAAAGSLPAQNQPAPPPPTPAPPAPTAPAPAAPAAPAPPAETPLKGANANLAAQVWLDRLGFSSGEIDGVLGKNLKTALGAYQRARNLKVTEQPDPPTLATLYQEANAGALAAYRITPEDAAGPFYTIPRKLVQQGKLQTLGYRNLEESLAERFHTSPKLLRQLNQGSKLAAGQLLRVPNALPPPEGKAAVPAARVVVGKSSSRLEAFGADGQLIFSAPVSSGSVHDPLPIGSWKVKGLAMNPTFRYNPKLFWDADSKDVKTTIPAGPNNPVGLVWVDLDKEHYGLHGTPEPGNVGHTQSHGCVRLTNWDALRLASLVAPGTPVIFEP